MTNVKRNNSYKFWHSPIALIIFFGILVLFGYKIIDLIEKNLETSNKKELILEKIDSLEQREKSLLSDISRLDTYAGKEEIIREKYKVAKEGEKMVTIVDEDENTVEENTKVNHGFWNWIKGLFRKD